MDENLNVSPHGSNTMLAADADYWLTAPKKEVKKFIEKNTDIKEYKQKKKQLLCKIQKMVKRSEQ